MVGFLKFIAAVFAMLLVVTIIYAMTKSGEPSRYDYRIYVEHELRDPSSAEYRDDRMYVRKSGRAFYCGEVNSRNGFGAMAGFTRFVVTDSKLVLFEPRGDDSRTLFEKYWLESCTLFDPGELD